ncbi:hypothetical protein TNCV_4319251 [Trichonephila clavipes]|nr:hypothetical protein TNCV_4319251 [Trichonephila clavipes]
MVIWALNKFRTYFGPLPVKVITDHAALTKLTKGKNLSSRRIRWALKLTEFDVEWEHRPGAQNEVANVLSRNPVEKVRLSLENGGSRDHEENLNRVIFGQKAYYSVSKTCGGDGWCRICGGSSESGERRVEKRKKTSVAGNKSDRREHKWVNKRKRTSGLNESSIGLRQQHYKKKRIQEVRRCKRSVPSSLSEGQEEKKTTNQRGP